MVFFKGKEFSDEDIIDILSKGEKQEDEVLSFLYIKYKNDIKKMILSRGGKEAEVKDIFQDSIITFYEKIKKNQYKRTGNIGAFLYGIASNKWYNLRKKNKQTINEEKYKQVNRIESVDTPYQTLVQKEKEEFALSLMNKLDEKCRAILEMSIYKKMAVKEIVLALGYKNEQIARNKRYHCLAALKAKIAESAFLRQTAQNFK